MNTHYSTNMFNGCAIEEHHDVDDNPTWHVQCQNCSVMLAHSVTDYSYAFKVADRHFCTGGIEEMRAAFYCSERSYFLTEKAIIDHIAEIKTSASLKAPDKIVQDLQWLVSITNKLWLMLDEAIRYGRPDVLISLYALSLWRPDVD